MNVAVTKIDLFGNSLQGAAQRPFKVRVWVMRDGVERRYDVTVRPHILGGTNSLLQADEQFQDDFSYEQYSMHHILRLVSDALGGKPVPLPMHVE